MRILITGGAGFVGSSLAEMLARDRADARIVAFDNLSRRGSELAPARLRERGVDFVHGDVRCLEDLQALGAFDLILDCSAEPSVQAGYDGGALPLVRTNLNGTLHCLELARMHGAALIFLSTSRVYPIARLRELPLEREGQRLVIPADRSGPGWSAAGIAADFPLDGHRSLYGATKYCSERLAEEYAAIYGVPVVINRCGVITGPWQMGKVDQGFVVLWAARHRFGGELAYRGFGGEGLQVRDVLHVADLYDLIALQIDAIGTHAGELYCVGGGPDRSVSLRELTALCRERGGGEVPIGRDPETHPADVPYHVTDVRDVTSRTGWQPRRTVEDCLDDVFRWLDDNAQELRPILGRPTPTPTP